MPSKPQLAALLCLGTLPAFAQQIPSEIADPANLMGEHVSPPALADTLPINHGAPALEQLLRKLRTRASMMLIVAHPDDEDSGLLTLESRGKGARVAMLTLTRGEGGQNLMTSDFNDALGLIRTQELLAEDRYTGVDQFFGTEVDFGFSKTKEESFRMWTHDRVLYDAVRSVRLYRPLVLASVFIGGVTDGHGQHQVSGEITQEVFLAAADPKVFPEMGLPPWAPLRVYARVPFAPITAQGMFDYATGKFLPPHFHNYVTGVDTTTPPAATVTIHEGEVPNIPSFEGKSYVHWARQGLALQKTQIGANFRVPTAGPYDVGYTLMASRSPCPNPNSGCPIQSAASSRNEWETPKTTALPSPLQPLEDDLFTGLDLSLPTIADLAPAAPPTLRTTLTAIDTKIAEAQRLYNPGHLDLTAPPLHNALRSLDTLIASTESATLPPAEKFNLLHELRIKRVQLNDALVLAYGLNLKPMTRQEHPSYVAVYTSADHSLYTSVTLANNGSAPVTVIRLNSDQSVPSKSKATPLAPSESCFAESTLHYAAPPAPTRPFFSRPSLEQPYYDISTAALRNAPATPNPIIASALVDADGAELQLAAIVPDGETVLEKSASPQNLALLPPSVPQAAVIIPPVSINLRRLNELPLHTFRESLKDYFAPSPGSVGVVPLAATSFRLGVQLDVHVFEDSVLGPARIGPGKIPVEVNAPAAWAVSRPEYDEGYEPVMEAFTISTYSLKTGQTYPLSAIAGYEASQYREGFRPVGYPGLTYTNFYTPATFRAVAVDVTTAPNLHIAYLPGTGDDVPAFLPSLNVTPTLLKPSDLTKQNLSQYDAILLGVRAYAAHPELAGSGSDALTAYAKQGGIVIVQYSSGGFNPASAPFPYTIPGDSAHNVVDEDQPVTLLAPQNPLLTWPNRITSADFDHWIEERGHGFATDWVSEYTPLLETHDSDQDPQKGGLLVAKVGKGAYIYCAFALYRQLPEGVPGAYRLLANLLSYAKNPSR